MDDQSGQNWEEEFNEFHDDFKQKDQGSDTSSTDDIFSSLKVGEHTSYGDWDKVLFEGTEKLVSYDKIACLKWKA